MHPEAWRTSALTSVADSSRSAHRHLPCRARLIARISLRTIVPYKFVGSPASEQSAHHAADQATWTATTAVVVVSTSRAATMGQMVVIGIVAAAGVGVRR